MARTKNRYRKQTSEETPLQTYRTGIYIRLSKERTETWRNKSQSLETQESLARAFAKEKGLVVTKCYIDYEYSGTTFRRPAYQDMMDDLKKGIINCILIRDLSRLGRNYIEMGRLIDKVFPFMGVRFISINDNIDTLNGLGDKKSFEVEIKNLVNDLYSMDISKKVIAYNIHQASQGYFIGSFPPYGYKLDKQEKGVKLVIDPIVQPVLNTVFEKLTVGQSIIAVTKYLNEERLAVPTAYRETGRLTRLDSDTREWKSANLLRLIKSPVYQGQLLQRKNNKSLAQKDYVHFEYAHEAYISSEDFERIQAKISDRKNSKKSAATRTPNRYNGLVYAKTKSTQMIRKCRHFSNNKSNYDYYYFTDYVYGTIPSERQTVYISENALDKIILELLQTEMKRLGTVETLLPRLEIKKDDCLKTYHKQIACHQRTIKQLQAELSDLYASFSLNRSEREVYLSQKNDIIAKIGTISQEIGQCETSIKQIEEEHSKQVNWVRHLAKSQNQVVLTGELLNVLIERIKVDVDKSVTITFTCQIGGDERD
ncbi:TPA: recombinase family protein [Streptococcus suis]|uniref:recombinase family protein n=1 Tax=Streptococcus suis TaxID=1307 RepID=UPI0004205AE4|nr:recombinase family protein [Streptococcus suis]MBS8077755.1 recombinase [Streptococcus suis]MCB2853353.1 recombinase family protein [Streptococcus suis]MCB2865318.1 recombinase family protein [Streptococcus suis]MCB2873627.1 recombinase family protein [Streptococcus suis]MCB2907774.1 recombinase family protein [Streptococcus suis]